MVFPLLSFQCLIAFATIAIFVIRYVIKIRVRIIAIVSDSLSFLPDFSPSAFAHKRQSVFCFFIELKKDPFEGGSCIIRHI